MSEVTRSSRITQGAPNLIEFVSTDSQNFMASLINFRTEIDLFGELDVLYRLAILEGSSPRSSLPLLQLLFLAHYQLLSSTASLLRCHLSDAWASTRVAIDCALIGATLIQDRTLANAWIQRAKPFDKLLRTYRNALRDGGQLPHPLVKPLIERYDFLSQYSSHADINTFVHRLKFEEEQTTVMTTYYYQFPENDVDFQIEILRLLRDFVLVIDVFSDFLVAEAKRVSISWKNSLHHLGGRIERRLKQLSEERIMEESIADDS